MRKYFKYFKGKKRNIGLIAGFILKGISMGFPDFVSSEWYTYIDNAIDIFLIGGILDSVTPDDVVSKSINKAKGLIKIKK